MSKRRLLCTLCELRRPGGKAGCHKTALPSDSMGGKTHRMFSLEEVCERAFFQYLVVLIGIRNCILLPLHLCVPGAYTPDSFLQLTRTEH